MKMHCPRHLSDFFLILACNMFQLPKDLQEFLTEQLENMSLRAVYAVPCHATLGDVLDPLDEGETSVAANSDEADTSDAADARVAVSPRESGKGVTEKSASLKTSGFSFTHGGTYYNTHYI